MSAAGLILVHNHQRQPEGDQDPLCSHGRCLPVDLARKISWSARPATTLVPFNGDVAARTRYAHVSGDAFGRELPTFGQSSCAFLRKAKRRSQARSDDETAN
jgi:hypothetical protein